MAKNEAPILEEILSSDRIGNYMALAYGLPAASLPEQSVVDMGTIAVYPWLAMAVYEDLEEKDAKVGSDLDSRKESGPRIATQGVAIVRQTPGCQACYVY